MENYSKQWPKHMIEKSRLVRKINIMHQQTVQKIGINFYGSINGAEGRQPTTHFVSTTMSSGAGDLATMSRHVRVISSTSIINDCDLEKGFDAESLDSVVDFIPKKGKSWIYPAGGFPTLSSFIGVQEMRYCPVNLWSPVLSSIVSIAASLETTCLTLPELPELLIIHGGVSLCVALLSICINMRFRRILEGLYMAFTSSCWIALLLMYLDWSTFAIKTCQAPVVIGICYLVVGSVLGGFSVLIGIGMLFKVNVALAIGYAY